MTFLIKWRLNKNVILFIRPAPSEEWRQIQTHHKWPCASASSVSSQAQAQPRERPDPGGEVGFQPYKHHTNTCSKIWCSCEGDVTFSDEQLFQGENECWAGAVARWPRGQHQLCSTAHRAPRPAGVQHPAPPALCPHMCTTPQSWTSHLPSSRNRERTQITQRKSPKATLPLKSR